MPPHVGVASGLGGDVGWGTTAMEVACGYSFTDNVLDNQALNPDEPLASIIEEVSRWTLDALQQDITMELKVPWPAVADKPQGYFAAPMATISGDTLRLWFEVDGFVLLSTSVSPSEGQ